MTRRATIENLHDICAGLPEVTFGTSWGDRPTYKVRDKGFVLFRAPHKTAVDPATGELYEDLIVVHTPVEEGQALVEDPDLPFFTIPHFRGYGAVLVQQSRLGELTCDELEEVLVDAWLTKAPKRLAKDFLNADVTLPAGRSRRGGRPGRS
ncbi:MmcQ/YjbR family DNA-binding protein [Arsenicicoccus piscis]|uniref:MmcQ/YjbR family DNA-binding protein n=1 Tax=Arsenicicoccus piscis TaxID=673954 RepID=A0ABQ6HUX0_9MICO|nr:MmcQ/YjbR family DNA-binding protein [Arsenicicoccus piscis]GMA21767.1 hypothetical protein GCM10025862_37880 [Arsenicicoccus piscis]